MRPPSPKQNRSRPPIKQKVFPKNVSPNRAKAGKRANVPTKFGAKVSETDKGQYHIKRKGPSNRDGWVPRAETVDFYTEVEPGKKPTSQFKDYVELKDNENDPVKKAHYVSKSENPNHAKERTVNKTEPLQKQQDKGGANGKGSNAKKTDSSDKNLNKASKTEDDISKKKHPATKGATGQDDSKPKRTGKAKVVSIPTGNKEDDSVSGSKPGSREEQNGRSKKPSKQKSEKDTESSNKIPKDAMGKNSNKTETGDQNKKDRTGTSKTPKDEISTSDKTKDVTAKGSQKSQKDPNKGKTTSIDGRPAVSSNDVVGKDWKRLETDVNKDGNKSATPNTDANKDGNSSASGVKKDNTKDQNGEATGKDGKPSTTDSKDRRNSATDGKHASDYPDGSRNATEKDDKKSDTEKDGSNHASKGGNQVGLSDTSKDGNDNTPLNDGNNRKGNERGSEENTLSKESRRNSTSPSGKQTENNNSTGKDDKQDTEGNSTVKDGIEQKKDQETKQTNRTNSADQKNKEQINDMERSKSRKSNRQFADKDTEKYGRNSADQKSKEGLNDTERSKSRKSNRQVADKDTDENIRTKSRRSNRSNVDKDTEKLSKEKDQSKEAESAETKNDTKEDKPRKGILLNNDKRNPKSDENSQGKTNKARSNDNSNKNKKDDKQESEKDRKQRKALENLRLAPSPEPPKQDPYRRDVPSADLESDSDDDIFERARKKYGIVLDSDDDDDDDQK